MRYNYRFILEEHALTVTLTDLNCDLYIAIIANVAGRDNSRWSSDTDGETSEETSEIIKRKTGQKPFEPFALSDLRTVPFRCQECVFELQKRIW